MKIPINTCCSYLVLAIVLMGKLQLRAQRFELKDFPGQRHTLNNTMDVELADLDGNGAPDLVLAAEFADNIILFNTNNGRLNVSFSKLLPENRYKNFPGQDSEDIAIADFDQDGSLDILFVAEDSPAHELLFNNGRGNFMLSQYRFPASVANGLAVADLNADSYPDVIIGNKGQNQVYINQQDKTFQDETDSFFPKNEDATQDLKLADIDGDGDQDLIEGIEDGGNNIYLFDAGKFTAANERLPKFTVDMETRKVAIGDVNNDGFPDLFYCNVSWRTGVDVQDRLLINVRAFSKMLHQVLYRQIFFQAWMPV